MATATTPPAADLAADLSPSERAAAGKAARERAPRSSHGEWTPATDRPDPVDVLEGQAADRVAELVPLRYGRMLVSAFTFYRGAAAIMAADLAATPSSGLWVQACGDAHLSNFGGYASPDRGLVVDINDFDETLPGPWEWDVKRLAASFEIAGRDRGFSGDAAAQDRAHRRSQAYRENMRASPSSAISTSGTGASTSTRSAKHFAGRVSSKEHQAVRAQRRQGPSQGSDAGVLEAHRAGRRRAADPKRSSRARPAGGDVLGQAARDGRKQASARSLEGYRETLLADRRHLLDGYRLRPRRRERSSASAASGPGRGSRCCSGATRTTRCSFRSRRRSRRCSSPTRRRPSTPSRASAWSRASG